MAKDVEVNIGPRGYNAFTAITDTHISIQVRGSTDPLDPEAPDYSGSIDVSDLTAQAGGETNKQFKRRVLRRLIKAFVELHEKKLDTDRRTGEVGNVGPVTWDVPDSVIE